MKYRGLNDHSRVWIYQVNRKLNDKEVSEIKSHGDRFISEWAAHGKDLQADFQIFYNRFIVLFADETQVKASGCSIDSSVRFIKEIEAAYGLDLFDRLNIAFKVNNKIDYLRINDFQTALHKGHLSESTIVFNNLVETKAAFETQWEVPLKESWHSKMLA
tara:strand:- start:4881 stop:5360 length:480 start_codon:yes stop_codon:yes gene_type:complete